MNIYKNEKPDKFHGSQEEWERYIEPRKKTFFQKPFTYHAYIADSENIQRIDHFQKCIKDGVLPDDETLSWIACSFERYINGPSLTLDSAFGLKSKTKKGTPIEQYKSALKSNDLLNIMARNLVENKNISQVKAAEMALNELKKRNRTPKL